MAIDVVEDTASGGSLQESKDGFACTRRFIIHGIPDGVDPSYTAMLEGKVPKRLDPHPSVPFIFCDSRNAQAVDGSKGIIEVMCSYKRLTRASERGASGKSKPQIEIGSSVVTVSTNKDKEGAAMECTRRSNSDTTTNQPVLAQIQVPQTTLRATRKEEKSPHRKSIDNVGKVNSAPIFEGDERTWLCTRIEGRSDDGGESFIVTYEFQYNPDTWDYRAYYINTATNLPYAQTDDPAPIFGSEEKLFEIYQQADFTTLELDIDGGSKGDGIGSGITGV